MPDQIYDEVFGPVEQVSVATPTKYEPIPIAQETALLDIQLSGILLMLSIITVGCFCMYLCSAVPALQQKRQNLLGLMAIYMVFVVVISVRRFS